MVGGKRPISEREKEENSDTINVLELDFHASNFDPPQVDIGRQRDLTTFHGVAMLLASLIAPTSRSQLVVLPWKRVAADNNAAPRTS